MDAERIRDISDKVYRIRLGQRDTESMIAKDGDQGQKLRQRAGSYDVLTRAYLEALEINE